MPDQPPEPHQSVRVITQLNTLARHHLPKAVFYLIWVCAGFFTVIGVALFLLLVYLATAS